ncbi:MAG: MaoC family dehydratase N-terminal domain-containing protein [Pseudomonadales bacterium]|nr:MaoC family dehydratase N-terminal domain-containing protein [Pseudomonadales bacterium]
MEYLENVPFDELNVGDTATLVREVTDQDIQLFAYLSGDINPVHLDDEYAKTTAFGSRIAHGLFSALLVTTAVATKLPGPGCIYRGQEMKFQKPVRIGDTLTLTLTIAQKKKRGNLVKIDCEIENQEGEIVFTGVSTAVAPDEKIRIKASELPKVTIEPN